MRTIRDGVRTVVTFGVMLPGTILYATGIWALARFRPNSDRVERLVQHWAKTCLWFAGVKLSVEGLEHVDTENSYVVVSNHLSGFDIMAHFAALPIPIRFLAKSELFKIPMFGLAMRAIGIVEVNRGAGRLIHEQINTTAKETVARGHSLIIYPEGTRPRDGVMGAFKKGGFTIATSMGLPVLPSAITGSRQVWKPGTKIIRSGPIHVTRDATDLHRRIDNRRRRGSENDRTRTDQRSGQRVESDYARLHRVAGRVGVSFPLPAARYPLDWCRPLPATRYPRERLSSTRCLIRSSRIG